MQELKELIGKEIYAYSTKNFTDHYNCGTITRVGKTHLNWKPINKKAYQRGIPIEDLYKIEERRTNKPLWINEKEVKKRVEFVKKQVPNLEYIETATSMVILGILIGWCLFYPTILGIAYPINTSVTLLTILGLYLLVVLGMKITPYNRNVKKDYIQLCEIKSNLDFNMGSE